MSTLSLNYGMSERERHTDYGLNFISLLNFKFMNLRYISMVLTTQIFRTGSLCNRKTTLMFSDQNSLLYANTDTSAFEILFSHACQFYSVTDLQLLLRASITVLSQK